MTRDETYANAQLQVQDVAHNLLQFMRQWRMQNRKLREEYGLSARKLAILRRLASEGPMTVGQIAATCYISCPTASETIDGLRERGYVTGYRGSQDARKRWITVTDEGRAVAQDAPRTPVEKIRHYLSGLGRDELLMMQNMIAELTASMISEESGSDQ